MAVAEPVADAARWDHTSYGYMVIHVFVQKLFNFFTKFNKINIIISSRTAHRAQPKIQTPLAGVLIFDASDGSTIQRS